MEDKQERVITIYSVKTLDSQTQAQAIISVSDINDGDKFGYIVLLDQDVDSEIHTYIKDKIKSGEVTVIPPDVTQEELDSENIKHIANIILRSTDQFMTIDTELTDEEVKEMKSYRATLRSIVKHDAKKSLLSLTDLPSLPKFLKSDDVYNSVIYVGSSSQER